MLELCQQDRHIVCRVGLAVSRRYCLSHPSARGLHPASPWDALIRGPLPPGRIPEHSSEPGPGACRQRQGPWVGHDYDPARHGQAVPSGRRTAHVGAERLAAADRPLRGSRPRKRGLLRRPAAPHADGPVAVRAGPGCLQGLRAAFPASLRRGPCARRRISRARAWPVEGASRHAEAIIWRFQAAKRLLAGRLMQNGAPDGPGVRRAPVSKQEGLVVRTVTPGSGPDVSGSGNDSRWSTIRFALTSWSMTARLCLLGLCWTGIPAAVLGHVIR